MRSGSNWWVVAGFIVGILLVMITVFMVVAVMAYRQAQ